MRVNSCFLEPVFVCLDKWTLRDSRPALQPALQRKGWPVRVGLCQSMSGNSSNGSSCVRLSEEMRCSSSQHSNPAPPSSTSSQHQIGVSQNYGYLFGGPHNKDYSILRSILGSPYIGKLPNWSSNGLLIRLVAAKPRRPSNRRANVFSSSSL